MHTYTMALDNTTPICLQGRKLKLLPEAPQLLHKIRDQEGPCRHKNSKTSTQATKAALEQCTERRTVRKEETRASNRRHSRVAGVTQVNRNHARKNI